MPDRTKYEDLSLGQALRELAELHYQARTRHISADEREMLLRAADQLDRDHPSMRAFTISARLQRTVVFLASPATQLRTSTEPISSRWR